MATSTTLSQLDGFFKEIYADKVSNLVPDGVILAKDIAFNEAEAGLGDSYHAATLLTHSHGVTYAAPSDGAFALSDPVSLTMKDAQVDASQMLLRDRISYNAATRALKSKRAYGNTVGQIVEVMTDSLGKHLEMGLLYGRTGWATAASSANASSTSTVVTVTTAQWASGIWAGSEGLEVQFYTSNTTLVSSSADSIFTVSSVNHDNRTLTVTGTSTGISALDTAISGNGDDVYIYPRTAFGKVMNGLDKIVTNTGSLFNISAADYYLWKGNTTSAGSAALSLNTIENAVAKAVSRGGLNEMVNVYVNPTTWKDLNSSMSAKRMFDSSYNSKKAVNGAERICYHSQNGRIDIVAHPFVKEGEAFGLPPKRVKRIGSTDITFDNPSGHQDEFFHQLADNAGFELRCYTEQAVFAPKPALLFKVSGIVNS